MRDKIEEALKLLEGMDGDWVDHDGIRVDKCDFGRVVDMLREALQSTADDCEPITAEWCLENGAQEVGDTRMYRWVTSRAVVDWDDANGVTLDSVEGHRDWFFVPNIITRGQLRHLLAALREGDE